MRLSHSNRWVKRPIVLFESQTRSKDGKGTLEGGNVYIEHEKWCFLKRPAVLFTALDIYAKRMEFVRHFRQISTNKSLNQK